MDNYDESLKKLETVARHECCLLSKTTLFPPRNAGEFSTTFEKHYVSKTEKWWLALDDEGGEVDIIYCPWCGIKLPTAEK